MILKEAAEKESLCEELQEKLEGKSSGSVFLNSNKKGGKWAELGVVRCLARLEGAPP